MATNKLVASAVAALGLTVALSEAASAAAPHGHRVPTIEMRLNNGQKWQTDGALRTGMSRIHDAVGAALPLIHTGRYGAAEFSALGDRIQEQVDYVVANCKLPEKADLQLHLMLTQVLDGINAMKGNAGQEQGAVAVVHALNAYGEHFVHPGWKPLRHQ